MLARLYRAGAGNDDHFGAADLHAADVDDRKLRPGLTADELKGLGDRDHVVYPGRDRKGLDFMAAASAADCRDNGALGASRDVRLESGLADALNDVVDLFFGGAVGHIHDHDDDLSIVPPKTKAAILSRLWRNL